MKRAYPLSIFHLKVKSIDDHIQRMNTILSDINTQYSLIECGEDVAVVEATIKEKLSNLKLAHKALQKAIYRHKDDVRNLLTKHEETCTSTTNSSDVTCTSEEIEALVTDITTENC